MELVTDDRRPVEVRDEAAELAEALVAVRRAATSSLLPDYAQRALAASAELLELFTPPQTLKAAD